MPKPFLCREAIEESNFASHFWELWSSDFSVIYFVGFQRPGRTRTYQLVTFLALL
jgi:hypothetical protein